ncbi:MAG TPA: hypothetical protein VHV26_13130 [Rhizomicrobium sp.]|jgi:hypothetical protein|nr:hypothetical protein [Rhizomicrobium sp.]
MRISWSWENDWAAVALIAAALLLAAPLWCVHTPMMPDYPAHLATFWLIGRGISHPVLAKVYEIHWAFIPNLASEMLVPLLARLVGLVTAIRIFLTGAVLMWVLGPGLVHRALYGRWGIAPLLGVFFAYNANFFWGFFNYYFAAGLGIIVFAVWIGCKKKTPLRLCAFAATVTAVYFCHVFAAASLLLMVASYEIADHHRQTGWNARGLLSRALCVAAVYLPAAIAFFLLRPANGGDMTLQFNLADTMIDRFESLIEHSFDDPAYLLPVLLFALLAAALCVRRAQLHPSLWGVIAILFVVSVFAPESAMGGWGVDLRLPSLFAILLFAAAELQLDRRLAYVLAGAALALVAWNAASLATVWRRYDRQVTELRAADSAIPRRARLLTVLDGNAIGERSDQPYWHMAAFAIIDRGAFTPLMFTTSGQHIVQLHQPYKSIAAATAQQGSPPDTDELSALAAGNRNADENIRDIFPYLIRFQCHFDQALVIHLDGRRSKVPPMLRLVRAGSFFALYDIRPDPACGQR